MIQPSLAPIRLNGGAFHHIPSGLAPGKRKRHTENDESAQNRAKKEFYRFYGHFFDPFAGNHPHLSATPTALCSRIWAIVGAVSCRL
jgi:hypothetical protein